MIRVPGDHRRRADQHYDASLHFTAEVNESIRVVQGRCSDAEFRSYRSACAKVLGELLPEMRS
jgi:hypothetical protein